MLAIRLCVGHFRCWCLSWETHADSPARLTSFTPGLRLVVKDLLRSSCIEATSYCWVGRESVANRGSRSGGGCGIIHRKC